MECVVLLVNGEIMKKKEITVNTEKMQRRLANLRPFKPGQSGNPKGKPKGTISLVSILKKKLSEMDRGSRKTFAELFIQKYLLKKAIVDEDMRIMKDVIDRIDGKPTRSIAGSTEHTPIIVITHLSKEETELPPIPGEEEG